MAEQNKRNLVKMLLLGFVTLGIYWLYWIYKVTQLSNHVKTLPERSPVAQLFLCMLVPFYDIYWYYQTSKRVDVMMASAGQESDSGILTILLTFFTGPVFASLFLQDKINLVLGIKTGIPVDSNISGALAIGIAAILLMIGLMALFVLNTVRSITQSPEAFQQGYTFGYSLITGELPEEENNEIELDAEESVRQTKDGRWVFGTLWMAMLTLTSMVPWTPAMELFIPSRMEKWFLKNKRMVDLQGGKMCLIQSIYT